MQYSKFSKAKYKMKKWKMGEGERVEEDEAIKPDFFSKKQEGMQEKMNTKSLFRKESLMDKRAVSPVIGEILMVAIVVIIAAVLAAFVFGVTPTTEKAPNVQLKATVTVSDNKLTLKHLGGDPISLDDCLIKVKGTEVTGTFSDDLTVGKSESALHGVGGISTGEAVAVEVIHPPSESYILDTVVTAQ